MPKPQHQDLQTDCQRAFEHVVDALTECGYCKIEVYTGLAVVMDALAKSINVMQEQIAVETAKQAIQRAQNSVREGKEQKTRIPEQRDILGKSTGA